jgi:hypothetical protein
MSESMRLREGWLMESLQRAAEEAKKLPAWAIAINRAYDRQYHPAAAAVRAPEEPHNG